MNDTLKIYQLCILLVANLLISCSDVSTIKLSSSSEIDLVDQCVVIGREAMNLGQDEYLILRNSANELIPVQVDDVDGDGIWDELALVYSLGAYAEVNLACEVVDAEGLPTYPIATNAYLGYSQNRDGQFVSVDYNERPADHLPQSKPYLYQFEGPAWESASIAFRTYFDSRNGKDIFGKTKSQLVVEEIGLNDDYHIPKDWGMDVLKVGTSLGAGSLAMYSNDSIYRLGETGEAAFRIITEGAVRSIIELSYTDWLVGDQIYQVKERLTIWANKRSYESEVFLSGGDGNETMVTGIGNLKGLAAKALKYQNVHLVYTHGIQSENSDNLGMAIGVPTENFVRFDKAPLLGAGVIQTEIVLLKPHRGAYRFQFHAGWEKEDSGFSSSLYYEEQLIREFRSSQQTNDIKIELRNR